MRIKINCHHKGRIKMQCVERSASYLPESLGASWNSRILSFAVQCHKGMTSSIILHLGCYTNTIKNSQHFSFDWLLKCLELSHTQAPWCKNAFIEAGSGHCGFRNSCIVARVKRKEQTELCLTDSTVRTMKLQSHRSFPCIMHWRVGGKLTK